MRVPDDYARAIARWGHLADGEARQYGLTGNELVARIISGESGFRMNAVSSANARGAGQFIPSTRASYVRLYHVDPWKDVDSAVHATAIYMQKGGGLKGYNPGGGQGYINYILGQKPTGIPRGRTAVRGGTTTSSSPSSSPSSSSGKDRGGLAVKGLLWITFAAAGFALMGLGAGRLLGLGDLAKQAAPELGAAAGKGKGGK